MASPPFDIAQTTPADSDIISQFPNVERTYRDVVESWLNILSDPATGLLRGSAITVPLVLTQATAGQMLDLVSTEAGAAAGPRLDLYRNSASPAASDAIGLIRFVGEDSLSVPSVYGAISSIIVDPTDGSEDGTMNFDILVAGASTTRLALNAAGASILGNVTLTSTDAGAATGPVLTLYRDSASPAAADNMGQITFQGEDSAGNAQAYGVILHTIDDPVSGSEDSMTRIFVSKAGVLTETLTISEVGVEVLTGTLVAAGGGSLTGTWSNLGIVTTVDINGGTIDGAVIGGASAAAGTFTTLTATTGTGISTLNASNLSTGTVPSARVAGSYTGITGVGALAAGSITDTFGAIDIGADALVAGSLTSITVFAASGGSITLRPNGAGSAVGQTTIAGSGNMAVNGNITSVADGVHTNNKTASNPATVGASMTSSGQLVAAITSDVFLIGNRISTDGSLVHLRKDNVTDGVISTAAGVVTYGTFFGSHWSQIVDNAAPLKGTIVDSVDELCYWEGEAELGQPNQHLPKVEVSNVAGSNKVYGVIAWNDEDGDWFIGALGAYMIRIQSGETVQIGDYIESAGNGCGRVQKDNILRASTVAKITSTHVAETYPDGSYLVPCTLHCG